MQDFESILHIILDYFIVFLACISVIMLGTQLFFLYIEIKKYLRTKKRK